MAGLSVRALRIPQDYSASTLGRLAGEPQAIWREEGLTLPKKQPKRKRLWFNGGSRVRLRPTHPNHVWSYRLVTDRTSAGRPIRMLTIVDEYTRERLAIDVAKRLTSEDVLERGAFDTVPEAKVLIE